MLELSQWGISNVNELFWITPPPPGAVNQAKELLEQLGALEDGRITSRGKAMLKLPTHPRIAHMLHLHAGNRNDLALATDVAALLEERDPLPRESGADLALRIEVLRKWRSGERVNSDRNILERVERLALSWRKLFNVQVENSTVADDHVGKLLATVYPERIARQTEKNSERYKLANGRVVRLPQFDPLMREQWLSVAHLDAGSGEGKIFLAAPLNEDDLLHLADERHSIIWDENRGMIVGTIEQRIGNLVLASKPLQTIPQHQRIKVLCDAIRAEGLKVLGWDDQHMRWQSRVMSLKQWRKEEAWPDVNEENLLQTLAEWLSPYLMNIGKRIELQRLELSKILPGIIPWELNSKLDALAPEKIEVPSGSMISVNYFPDGRSPYIEVRLQEVFGLTETPTINEGRTKIILHLLSPGYKPVQVTQDLKSFWKTTYHEVRKELRMRYPRHSWPEDPWTAEAVRGAKRRK
jgi:ATP-dependent helicase HrpB